MKLQCACLLVVMVSVGPVAAQDVAGECERLASSLSQSTGSNELETARLACESAVVENPASANLLQLYAKTLDLSGQDEAAQRLIEWAESVGQEGPAPSLEVIADGTAGAGNDIASDSESLVPIPDSAISLAESFGPDPLDALRWVADNIALDVYSGAMRGARGTLSARSGSASDQALLLKALAVAANPEVRSRFASCNLPATEVARLFGVSTSSELMNPKPLIALAGEFAPMMEDPEVRRIAERLAIVWRDTVETVVRHGDQITDKLAELGVETGLVPMSEKDVRAALTTHVWLQVQQGESWLDLDPSSSAFATAQCAPSWTGEALPDEIFHLFRVEVVLETRADGELVEKPLLDQTFRTGEIPQGNLSLMMAEPVGREGLLEVVEPPPDGYWGYTPLLRMGNADFLGETFPMPRPSTAEVEKDLQGAVGGILGGLDALDGPVEIGTAEASDLALRGPEVSALTLRLSVISPASPTEVFESAFFDRIGFAARARGDALIAPLTALAEVDGDYQALATIWNVALWTGAGPNQPDSEQQVDDPLNSIVAGLSAVHSNYDGLRLALVADSVGVELMHRVRLLPGLSLLAWIPSDNTMGADLLMDVLSEPSLPLPGTAETSATNAAWAASLVIGERLLLGMDRALSELSGTVEAPATAPVDVPAIFDLAASNNVPVIWVNANSRAEVQASDEALARIDRHLAEGLALLSPKLSVQMDGEDRLGWWLFDPETGHLFDQFENGRHNQYGQNLTLRQMIKGAIRQIKSLGTRAKCSLPTIGFAIEMTAFILAPSNAEGFKTKSAVIQSAEHEAAGRVEKALGSVKNRPTPGAGC